MGKVSDNTELAELTIDKDKLAFLMMVHLSIIYLFLKVVW